MESPARSRVPGVDAARAGIGVLSRRRAHYDDRRRADGGVLLVSIARAVKLTLPTSAAVRGTVVWCGGDVAVCSKVVPR
jgi:hypothetical protein